MLCMSKKAVMQCKQYVLSNSTAYGSDMSYWWEEAFALFDKRMHDNL
jgi:hypothetical protein